MIGYMAILAAGLSGYGGMGFWAIPATAIALASLSYAQYGDLYRRGRKLGLTEVTQTTLLHSFANALMAASMAYAMGFVMRLV